MDASATLRAVPAAVACGLAVSWCLSGCGRREQTASALKVRINGHEWFVDLAATQQQRYVGLGGRGHIEERAGMLFVYPSPRVLYFCMRDCPEPLDVAFINGGLEIIRVHTMMPEDDLAGRESYCSDSPALYALEVPGGSLGRAGVRVGDRVELVGDFPDPSGVQDDR